MTRKTAAILLWVGLCIGGCLGASTQQRSGAFRLPPWRRAERKATALADAPRPPLDRAALQRLSLRAVVEVALLYAIVDYLPPRQARGVPLVVRRMGFTAVVFGGGLAVFPVAYLAQRLQGLPGTALDVSIDAFGDDSLGGVLPRGWRARLNVARKVCASVNCTSVLEPAKRADVAWYQRDLVKPRWAPRAWVFPLAWLAVLKPLQLWAILVHDGAGRRVVVARGSLVALVALGDVYNRCLFSERRIGCALVVSVAYVVAATSALMAFAQVTPPLVGAIAFLPTVSWAVVIFALTLSIWQRNGRGPLYPAQVMA